MALADEAYTVIARLARQRRAFSSEDAWNALEHDHDEDARAVANGFIRAEREQLVRNSLLGVYIRGRQAHRRWLAVWLSVPLSGTFDDATAYARDAQRRG